MEEGRVVEEHVGPVVYVLERGRGVYVGATTCLQRRVRQHNGEVGGGAKRTGRGGRGGWEHVAHVEGFRTFREALFFEWAMRRSVYAERRKGKEGERAVLDAAREVMRKERWTRRAPPSREVPLCLTTRFAPGKRKEETAGKEGKEGNE